MSPKPTQIVESPGHYEEPEDGQVVEVTDLALMTSAEIDKQITTARAYPRSLKKFRDEITELATLDEGVARSCIYVVPRDGKMIDGPSARFAEILVSCWGNNRSGGRIVSADDEFVTGQGFFFDLEKNTAITYEVKRRIVGSSGKRYSLDMIMTTGNAATSIAHRNAVLKGIPKALWSYALDKAKAVVAGDQETLTARRVKMMKELGVCGATPNMVYALIGVKGMDDITTEHMVLLGGLYTSIKEGDLSVEKAFAHAGEMVPPRPNRSEFDRKEGGDGKGGDKKDGKKKADAKPKDDKGKPAADNAGGDKPAVETKPDPVVEAEGKKPVPETTKPSEPEVSGAKVAADKWLAGYISTLKETADLDDFKKRGRITIESLDGLTEDDRDALRRAFSTVVLTEQRDREKRK